jgi:DNA-binding PadR family transcriptional regulator
MWGYKIKKQAEAKFDVKVRHGALYPLLNALEKKGYLISQRQKQGGRTRKVYTITKKGKEYLDAYSEVLRQQLDDKDVK